MNDVADLVKEQVLKDIGHGISPVTGRAFKGLSAKYARMKRRRSGRVMPNLELSGRMLDALTVDTKGNELEYYVSGSDQQGKVDGHNNFTGKSKLPQRKFIPASGESLRAGILDKIRQTIETELESDA